MSCTMTAEHMAYDGIESEMPQAWWDNLPDIAGRYTVQSADPLSHPIKNGLLMQVYGASYAGYDIHAQLARINNERLN